ncbi:MAG: DinB family protein [Gemmatimonadaceae bacterium]
MTLSETLLPEFDQEMATTRRVLERVPTETGEWKPHDKSFSLAHLAQLVATMPGWITKTVSGEDIDLAGGPGYSTQTTESLLSQFDRHVTEARAAIEAASDDDFALPWSLKMGGEILFTLPRSVTTRTHINHLVHHRGQLTVYLRLIDVPVPSIYGPTADEPWSR